MYLLALVRLNLFLIYKCCVYAQSPLEAWPDLETQACYNAPGDLLDANLKKKKQITLGERLSLQ